MKYVFIEKHQAEFSIKAMCRVLRVARTVADIAAEERVGESAVAEALRHRGEVEM